jgi:hypothetical protein
MRNSPASPADRAAPSAPVTTKEPAVRSDAQSLNTQVVPGTGYKSGGPNQTEFGPNERREQGGTTTTPSGAPASQSQNSKP